jgi:carbon storage regulator CsrA
MLVLARRPKESIVIRTRDGQEITLLLVECRSGWARLGFTAPPEIEILRREIANQPGDSNGTHHAKSRRRRRSA